MNWVAVSFLAGTLSARAAETTKSFLDEFKIPVWYKDFTIRSGGGYKDNVLLSSAAHGSAFWTVGGDVLIFRLPTSGWKQSWQSLSPARR